MADKPKYDLSNVGGQPKDWVQRGKEYDAEFSWWDDIKLGFGPILLASMAVMWPQDCIAGSP